MFNNILIICTANICRSPMAEGILKAELLKNNAPSKTQITSAGIKALVNEPADSRVIEVMQEIDINITNHKAKQLSETLAKEADLILTMQNHHKQQIEFIFPFCCGKVFLLGKWQNQEIPDPYLQQVNVFRACRQLIQQCLQDWQKKIWK